MNELIGFEHWHHHKHFSGIDDISDLEVDDYDEKSCNTVVMMIMGMICDMSMKVI